MGLLTDPVRRARLGAAARALVEANRGARGKTMSGHRARAAAAAIPATCARSGWSTDCDRRTPRSPRVPPAATTRAVPHLRRGCPVRSSASATSPSAGARRRRSRPTSRRGCARWASAPPFSAAATAARAAADGVVVVRDRDGIRADLDRSGDEPLMLARQLDGRRRPRVAESLSRRRLAEHHFGCTVHVLDDGFQHFQLRRDVDIVVVAPRGHRPAADAAVWAAARTARRASAPPTRSLPSTKALTPIAVIAEGRPIVAARVGGSGRRGWRSRCGAPVDARTRRRRGGCRHRAAVRVLRRSRGRRAGRSRASCRIPIIIATRARDVAAIVDAARGAGAGRVVTTEKDFVRLLPFRPFPMPVAYVPLTVAIEPPETFDAWLRTRLQDARAR